MRFFRDATLVSVLLVIAIWLSSPRLIAAPPVAAPDETTRLETPDFTLLLTRSSQTVAALRPRTAPDFDFTPGDRLAARSADGYHQLGDLMLRVRHGAAESWQRYDTAAARHPVMALPVADPVLAAADLSPTLPADCPVQISRSWTLTGEARHLALRFEIKNVTAQPVEIGALDVPMVFNNIITSRTREQAHRICSFSDPYLGQDAGYLQVTRLNGHGPALLVVPADRTHFEAYQPLDEPMPRAQTFEGVLAWSVHTLAHAEAEWRGVQPWNPPSSATLEPGQTRTYGFEFILAPEIRAIDQTLAGNGRPLAVGIPGYVLPTDLEGRLFLHYGRVAKDISVEPTGAITAQPDAPTSGGWQAYTLRGHTWGRARLTVTYEDGTRQTIHYFVTKPAAEVVHDLGHFLLTRQWFDPPDDPFGRSPSVISYDREKDRPITQESRVWIAGLGDEAGSGSWLAAAMKEFGQPDPEEVAKYERFIDLVLWGTLQNEDGANRYGVRKSAFFHDPKALPDFQYDSLINWRSWTSWNRAAAADIGRGYNYPHVVAAYWAMYHVARNHPGMVKNHPWEWYLEQACRTTQFMFSRDANGARRVGYVELGLMEGTVFLRLLEDLRHEGWNVQAVQVEALMKERADRWKTEAYPFGSEMTWDSTGQEEVYAWCNYFGYTDQAQTTIDAILGYMPTIPHWGYNGNARRYWDFLYGGKLPRIERQIHHYGSGLNAIPVLTQFRQHPDDFHLLRVGYGGMMGALTNVDQEGFASAAFHSYPQTLRWDAYSGDYGPNFFGHALNAATYVVQHPEFGWLAFGGDIRTYGDWVRVTPRDAFRSRVYIAPVGLWLTLEEGNFAAVEYNVVTKAVRVGLTGGSRARLRVEQPAKVSGVGVYQPTLALPRQNDSFNVDLPADPTWVELKN